MISARIAALVWLLPVAVPAVAVPAVAGSAGEVVLRVLDDTARVGEPLLVELLVETQRAQPEKIEFPEIPGCTVRSLGAPSQSTSVRIESGRQTMRVELQYLYELTPSVAGEVEIPAISVVADGRVMKTEPVRIPVIPSDAQEFLSVEIVCPTRTLYVGQKVRLKLEIWVKPARALSRMLTPQEMFRCFDGRTTSLGPFPVPQSASRRKRPGAGDDAPTYYVFETEVDHVLQRPGPLEFDDVVVTLNYPTRYTRDRWGDERIDRVRTLRARAAARDIAVLPLPLDGQPQAFTGAVGRFRLNAAAEPTTVRVGDPIELTLTITGEGALETLPPPDLRQQPMLNENFRVPSEELAGREISGMRRFTQTIRARRAGVREIPPIEYVYFDPELGKYQVARSQHIPITVTGADTLSAADLPGGAATDGAGPRAIEPLDGLRGNTTDERRLLAVTPAPTFRQVAVVTATPAAVFGMTWLYLTLTRLRSADPRRARRREALRVALGRLAAARALPRAEAARAVEATLAQFLSDRTGEPAARLSGRAGLERLRAARGDAALLADFAALLDRCESLSYGAGGDAEAETLFDHAARCLRGAERVRL